MPSQISGEAVGASQALHSPDGRQRSTPQQVPWGALRLHERVSPAVTALHSQVPVSGMHCLATEPSSETARQVYP